MTGGTAHVAVAWAGNPTQANPQAPCSVARKTYTR